MSKSILLSGYAALRRLTCVTSYQAALSALILCFAFFNNTVRASGVADVVTAAQAFKATLSSTQVSTLQKTYTTTLAGKWSNLPCGSGCRNGIQLSTLNTTQLAAAKAVMQAALGTTGNSGYEILNQILIADDYLNANGGGSGYSSGIYFISFLNEPSTTGAWMLQFGGHHMAFTVSFNNGKVVGTTPEMLGVEPTSFTTGGTTYTPLANRRTVLQTMLAGLSSSELATAKLSATFSDCLMSPGESNGNTNSMPSTKQGLAVSSLTSSKQTLVLNAIKTWTADMDTETETALNTLYSDGLSETYVAWTGSGTSGNASTFLNANTNYVRIDGPRVWIEFVCQNGVIFSSQIHYHSVWRDHTSDYGSDLTATALPVTLAAFSGYRKNNALVVEWTTTAEKNNAYFEVEVSGDGKAFTKIGTVLSKAPDGNADTPISYLFTFDISDGVAFLGLYMLGISLTGLAFGKRNKRFLYVVLCCSICSIISLSCSKNDENVDSANQVFIRLKQVNKDGSFEYSKVIQAFEK